MKLLSEIICFVSIRSGTRTQIYPTSEHVLSITKCGYYSTDFFLWASNKRKQRDIAMKAAPLHAVRALSHLFP